MSKQAYLGLDLGGSGSKAGVFDVNGQQLGFGRVAITPSTSPEGFTEIPISKIHEAAREAVRMAVAESAADIRAMAVSSQGQTFVSLDKHNQPLHDAIIWYDSRASEQARALQVALEASNSEDQLPLVEAISTAPKIMWLRDRLPDMMSRSQKHLLLPDYMSYVLTGRAITDPCTAASTGLYAEDAPSYSQAALSAAGISLDQLAEIMPSGTVIGHVRNDIADDWGLSAETLLVVGTNDQYAGALGAGNSRPGIISETTGTCLALVTLAERLPECMPSGLFGGRFPISKYQFALAYAKTAGIVLDWYRREFNPTASLSQLDDMARLSPVGSNGVTVLPHFDGMVSPMSYPDARGCFCNLTLSSSGSDLYRAILESLSFSLRENIELLNENRFNSKVVRSIGGAAKSDFWLQMKADVIGLPVERPRVSEAATLGAAAIAAAGAGEFASIQDASDAVYHADRVFRPDSVRRSMYDEPYHRYQSLWRCVFTSDLVT